MSENAALPLEQTEWIYDAEKCVQQQRRKWEAGGWKNVYLISTSYDGNFKTGETFTSVNRNSETIEKSVVYNHVSGKLMAVMTYRGKPDNNELIEDKQFIYNNIGSLSRQEISYSASSVTQKFAWSVKYNSQGQTDSLIVSDVTSGVDTVNLFLTVYRYDDNQLLAQIQKKWNPNAKRWVNKAKSEYIYLNDSLIQSETLYEHGGMFWTPLLKYEYTYDSKGYLTRKIMYEPIYKEWRKIFTIDYGNIEYNKPNLMESKYNFWGGKTGDFVSNHIPFYFNDEMSILKANKLEVKYIIDPTAISNTSDMDDFLKIYPNPSEGVFYISTQKHTITHWEVFSLSGTNIRSGINSYRTGVIDLTGTPSGLYLLKAYTLDNKLLIQKISIR